MSCPKNRSNFYKKPGKNFIWAEINGNPNLYCWIPAPLKDFNPKSINIDDINIQDIPPPVISDTFEDEINTFSKNAIKNKYTEGLSKLKKKYSDEDLVSVDDIEKYSIVKNFIAKRGLKIYGGTAINAYLPPEAKFYTDDEMPDYDFFSPDPWNDAVMLADNFNDLGYKFVEAKAGIHKGTYKVFVNLWPVADITYMNKKDIEKIPVKKIKGKLKKPILEMMKHFIKGIAKFENFKGALVYDALAAFYLIDPNSCNLEQMNIVIEDKGEYTDGMCVVDKRAWSDFKPNIDVVVKINRDKFVNQFIKTLSI
jgi:hypothetical protein